MSNAFQTPFDPAPTGNEEENKAVENGQLAMIHRWEEIRPKLKLPVKLKISHGHRAATEESRRACLKPQHYRQPSRKFDDPAKPSLRPNRWPGKIGKYAQYLLSAVEGKHESRHDSHQRISMVRELFKLFHACLHFYNLSPFCRGPVYYSFLSPQSPLLPASKMGILASVGT